MDQPDYRHPVTILTERDEQLLAALLRQSAAVKLQAEAISTAAPAPTKPISKGK